MSKDKEKLIARAQVNVRKGQIDKAIKDYKDALELDKKDVRLYMQLGNLYAKKKENKPATDAFLAAANYLTKDGFYSRAVAVYKQIIEIDESRSDILITLADLYSKLGLNNEAMAQYQKIGQQQELDGKLKEAIETTEKILGMDPRNVLVMTKLAELHMKSGNKDSGYRYFQQAIDQLKEEGRAEQALKLLEKLAKADPDNNANLLELGRIYKEHERWDRVYAVYARLHQNQPSETEPLDDLAEAAVRIGRGDEAVKFLKELAVIYKTKGHRQKFKNTMARVLEIRPDDPEAMAVVGSEAPILRESAAASAEPEEQEEIIDEPVEILDEAEPEEEVVIDSGPIAEEKAKPAGGKSLSAEEIKNHLTEAGVYLKYGLRDKALEHIRNVLRADPENITAHLRLKEALLETGDTEKAIKELEWLTRKGLEIGDTQVAQDSVADWLRLDPNSAVARQFESKVASAGKKAAKPAPAPAAKPAPTPVPIEVEADVELEEPMEEVVQIEAEVETAEEIVEEVAEVEAVEAATEVAEEVEEVADEVVEEVVESEADSVMLDSDSIELEEPEPPKPVAKPAPAPKPAPAAAPAPAPKPAPAPAARPAAPAPVAAKPAPAPAPVAAKPAPPAPKPAPAPAAAAPAPKPAAPARSVDPHADELEEAEFYLQQGLNDEAKKIYLTILASDPTHKVAVAKLSDLEAAQPEEVVISEGAGADFSLEAEAAEPVAEEAVPEPPPVEPKLPPVKADLEPPPAPEPEPISFEPDPAPVAVAPPPPPVPAYVPPPPPPAPVAVAPPPPPAPAYVPPPPPPASVAVAPPPPPAPAYVPPPPPPAPVAVAPPPPPAPAYVPPPPPPAPVAVAPPPPPAPAYVPMPSPVAEGFNLKAEVESEPAGQWFVAPAEAPTAKDIFGEDKDDGGLFDLAAELEKDDEQAAPAAGGFGFSTSEEFSVEETLSAFKRGVAKTISEHDSTTHFDLGIAFKEMGLANDAIGEFFTASRDPSRYFECMMMASMIMRESGEYKRAIETCRTALSSEEVTGKDAASIYFELGQALQALGRTENALWAIQQGQSMDPEYGALADLLGHLAGVNPAPLSLTEPLPDLPEGPGPGSGLFGGNGEDEEGLSMDDLGDDELDAAFGDEPAAATEVSRDKPQPDPSSGPPPSREPTTWEKAALDTPLPEAGQVEPRKKAKKISYV